MAVTRPADLAPTSSARAILGVSARTLRRYIASGKLPDLRSPAEHRVFPLADQHTLIGEHENRHAGILLYARVSCAGQEDDLVRQVEDLERAAEGRTVLATYHDVASGLPSRLYGARANAWRKALRAALEKELVA